MNRSVLRAISLLKVFQCEDEWVSASEISRRAPLPFASTHRLLQTLEQTGAVDKGESGAYRLGYLITALSQNVNIDDCLHRASLDLISSLSHKLDISVFLGRLENKMVTLIGRAFATTSKHRFVAAGSQFAAHGMALGRVLLADLPIEEIDMNVSDHAGARSAVQAPSTKRELVAELALIRKQGFAVDREQSYPGLGSVAVPVRDNDGQVFASLSASDELQRFTPSRIALLRDELLRVEATLRKRIFPAPSISEIREIGGDEFPRRSYGARRRVNRASATHLYLAARKV